MPNVHNTLADLKAAVTLARAASRAEARENCGRGFFRSRGAEFVAVDAQGNKLNESAAYEWDGTARDLIASIARLIELLPACARIDLEGGWDFAPTMADMRDGGHDPLVSEWALKVWTAA